jgi:hypothetical protein
MHCLFSVYCVITPLHVPGVSAVHHREVERVHVANGTNYTSELTVNGPAWPTDSTRIIVRRVGFYSNRELSHATLN